VRASSISGPWIFSARRLCSPRPCTTLQYLTPPSTKPNPRATSRHSARFARMSMRPRAKEWLRHAAYRKTGGADGETVLRCRARPAAHTHDQTCSLRHQPRAKLMKSCTTVVRIAIADCVRPIKCLGTMVINEDCATTPPSARKNPNRICIITAPTRNATNGVAIVPNCEVRRTLQHREACASAAATGWQ